MLGRWVCVAEGKTDASKAGTKSRILSRPYRCNDSAAIPYSDMGKRAGRGSMQLESRADAEWVAGGRDQHDTAAR
jgi:hypothetical protein